MHRFTKKLAENWKFLTCILLICIVLLPMIYTIFFTLPAADDFVMANQVEKDSLFADSIRCANYQFFNWTGLWIYMFLESYINPLIRFSLESYGLGIEMVCLFLLFTASLFSAIKMAAEKILGVTEKAKISVYFLSFLFVFLNTNIYQQIYYWFVGSSYMMAMTLGLFTIALTIRFLYASKITARDTVLLAVVGALTCNFFQEAILPGMVYLVLWVSFSIKERKPLWKKTIPFLFMLLSGVIAVAAPGNYVRRRLDYSPEINLISAVVDSIKILVIILKHMIQQPLVIALLVLGIYIGIRHTSKTIKGIYAVLAVVLSLATLLINVFPIALGYAGTGYFPNRVYFVFDFVLLIGMVVSAVCVGMYVKGVPELAAFFTPPRMEIRMVTFVFLLLYSTLVYNQNISKLPWSQTVASVGNVKELHDVWQECLIEIRDSEDRDVVIGVEESYFDSSILQLPRLTDNPYDWKNEAAAKFFGKETVTVIEQSEND